MPVTPAGRLVIVDGERINGVLPDLLRERGALVGCEFAFSVLPRARAERAVFTENAGDIYLPALRKPDRDRTHVFVPLHRQGLAVVSLRSHPPLPTNFGDLLREGELRGAFVRGFWLGPSYETFLGRLGAAKRADLVSDIDILSGMLRAGRANFTLLPYVPGFGALDSPINLPLEQGLFRVELLPQVPRSENGLYLSARNLSPADMSLLLNMFERASADGAVKRAFLNHYPADIVEHIRF